MPSISSGMATHNTTMQVRIPTDLKTAAQERATKEGIDLSTYVRKALEERLERSKSVQDVGVFVKIGKMEIPLAEILKADFVLRPIGKGAKK